MTASTDYVSAVTSNAPAPSRTPTPGSYRSLREERTASITLSCASAPAKPTRPRTIPIPRRKSLDSSTAPTPSDEDVRCEWLEGHLGESRGFEKCFRLILILQGELPRPFARPPNSGRSAHIATSSATMVSHSLSGRPRQVTNASRPSGAHERRTFENAATGSSKNNESELADHQIERVGWERVGLGVGDNKLNVVNARCASPLRRHVR
jgi:hypothetical protein